MSITKPTTKPTSTSTLGPKQQTARAAAAEKKYLERNMKANPQPRPVRKVSTGRRSPPSVAPMAAAPSTSPSSVSPTIQVPKVQPPSRIPKAPTLEFKRSPRMDDIYQGSRIPRVVRARGKDLTSQQPTKSILRQASQRTGTTTNSQPSKKVTFAFDRGFLTSSVRYFVSENKVKEEYKGVRANNSCSPHIPAFGKYTHTLDGRNCLVKTDGQFQTPTVQGLAKTDVKCLICLQNRNTMAFTPDYPDDHHRIMDHDYWYHLRWVAKDAIKCGDHQAWTDSF